MKEDLHIKIAADLADTDAPEKLSDKRTKEFVSNVLGQKSQGKDMAVKNVSFLLWGGSAVAVAASIVLAVMVFSPREYGNPSQLIEMQSIHSSSADIDTSLTEVKDTVLVYDIVAE